MRSVSTPQSQSILILKKKKNKEGSHTTLEAWTDGDRLKDLKMQVIVNKEMNIIEKSMAT